MANRFKQAAPKAKKLYKTGRYKTFADAMKAALNSTARAPKKKKPFTRKAKRKLTTKVQTYKKANRRTGTRKKPLLSKKSAVKKKLANALLDYELATTISATKEAQKRKVKYRKELRKL